LLNYYKNKKKKKINENYGLKSCLYKKRSKFVATLLYMNNSTYKSKGIENPEKLLVSNL
jgi:hypothetical protein